MARILMIEGHPDPESFGAALARAFAEGAQAAGAEVTHLPLGVLSFDPVLRVGHRGEQPLEPDLLAARQAIEAADHLVIQFPVWWGTLPALLKGFIDRVFLPGWAFRNTGRALPEGLLAGRSAGVLATMDSPWWWYRLKHGRGAHRSLIDATLNYVGIGKVWQRTVYQVRKIDPAGREAWLSKMRVHGAQVARGLEARVPVAVHPFISQ
jgi:putative NADPH-quinone reductase